MRAMTNARFVRTLPVPRCSGPSRERCKLPVGGTEPRCPVANIRTIASCAAVLLRAHIYAAPD